jgi:hypothetical protein
MTYPVFVGSGFTSDKHFIGIFDPVHRGVVEDVLVF